MITTEENNKDRFSKRAFHAIKELYLEAFRSGRANLSLSRQRGEREKESCYQLLTAKSPCLQSAAPLALNWLSLAVFSN